jgi:IS5 family transposase
VDAESGLVHTVIGTAANVNDVTQATGLLHGEESDVFADAGYQGVAKREEAKGLDVTWHVAMRPGKRKALDKNRASKRLIDELEKLKASIRAKAEHPFRVIKLQFGFAKVRFKGLAKNTARLQMLFAMSNLWMSRKLILQRTQEPSMGWVRPLRG